MRTPLLDQLYATHATITAAAAQLEAQIRVLEAAEDARDDDRSSAECPRCGKGGLLAVSRDPATGADVELCECGANVVVGVVIAG